MMLKRVSHRSCYLISDPEYTGTLIDKHDNVFWYKDGKFHREDGPACEWANGSKEWYINGVWHREDGPARIGVSGSKAWMINGKLHREDGPAVEHANGYKSWWFDNKEFTEEEHKGKVRSKKLDSFLSQ